jgi:hypothetical protein
MCKLAGWTACKDAPLSRIAADRALQAAAEVISKTERNGFGFAQAGGSGLRGRFVDPSDFRSLVSLPQLERVSGSAFSAFAASKTTDQSGRYHKNKSTIVHGRTATCSVSLENTHPFRYKGWTLAHNGVVTWHGQKTREHASATCDSQHLLYAIADHAGNLELQRQSLEDITGYAAFLALSPRGKLIVARDSTASLYAGVTKKGRWIFGTTASIVEAIADAWNCSGVDAYKLDDWTWLEFSAQGGRPKVFDWKHREASYRETRYSGKSLGRKLDYRSGWDSDEKSSLAAYSGPTWKRSETDKGDVYYTQQVPSETTGVVTQHNLDDIDERPINLRYDDSDAELERQLDEALGVGDYIPASQRTLEGIL